MKRLKPMITAIIFTASFTQITQAAELQPATLAAWNAYQSQANTQFQERAEGRQPFLWMDESPERAARVRRGQVVFAPVLGHGSQSVPHGLIHDWIGAIFIPGATIDSLWAVVHDYDDYHVTYGPVVSSSKTLACDLSSQEFQMIWQRKVLFVRAAMRGHYESRDYSN